MAFLRDFMGVAMITRKKAYIACRWGHHCVVPEQIIQLRRLAREDVSFVPISLQSAKLWLATDNMMTPGSHRQPLGSASQVPGSGLRVTAHLNNWQGHSNPARVPLSSINENVQGRPHGSHAPGVSATMRQGTPQGKSLATCRRVS